MSLSLRASPSLAALLALPPLLAASAGCGDEPASAIGTTEQELYSDLDGVGSLGGVEWQIDAPWRMEPTVTAQGRSYDPIPLTITFHDVSSQEAGTPFSFRRFCGLYVIPLVGNQAHSPVFAQVDFLAPEHFHEIEASKAWLETGGLTPGPASHLLRRMWNGDSPEDVLDLSQWAEWNATVLYQPPNTPVGSELRLITVARVSQSNVCYDVDLSPNPAGQLLYQLKRGRVSHYPPASGALGSSGHAFFFGEFLRVAYPADPMPRFDQGWVYGDLHYHAQGTDNEGESGIAYRAVLLAMKAMGLDFAFATDHASNSEQITSGHALILQSIPILPEWTDFLVDWLLDYFGPLSAPALLQKDALRDLSQQRFEYLLDWLNLPDGANHEIEFSGGSLRAPQLFLGAEVDVIPEMSAEEESLGRFVYARRRAYKWRDACSDVPDLVLQALNYAEACWNQLSRPGSAAGRFAIKDVQGPLQISNYARQHLVHLPSDPHQKHAFIPSNTSEYGGATRYLSSILAQEMPQPGRGYVFLAHPTSAAHGNDWGRMGPDIVPYSDTQLEIAFASPYVLGLQLWNENKRFHTGDALPRAFPFLYKQGVDDPDFANTINQIFLDWRWQERDDNGMNKELADGTVMWDQVLLWGLDPARTAQLAFVAPGKPRKFFMAGGSDAHGDLNYRREGRLLGWAEANDTAIGKPRNLVYVGPERPATAGSLPAVGQSQVLEGLASGQFSVTDGPALRIAIDRNGNGVIDAGDVPMGGDITLTGTETIPVLVEWRSTAEFGRVTTVDLYVGAHTSGREGQVYAPILHGPRGAHECIDSAAPIKDPQGRTYCPLKDGYVRDLSDKLRLEVPSNEGYQGVRRIELSPFDYRLFDVECKTETIWIDVEDGKPPQPFPQTTCKAINPAAPERLFVRAFAQTDNVEQGQKIDRYAFTNPIWVNAEQSVEPPPPPPEPVCTCTPGQTRACGTGLAGTQTCQASCDWGTCVMPQIPAQPAVHIEHASCSYGTNTFIATVAAQGSIPATSLTKQYRIANGAWKTLTSTTISAPGGQSVGVRARACAPDGCSAYKTVSRTGPACSTGGGGGGGGGPILPK